MARTVSDGDATAKAGRAPRRTAASSAAASTNSVARPQSAGASECLGFARRGTYLISTTSSLICSAVSGFSRRFDFTASAIE